MKELVLLLLGLHLNFIYANPNALNKVTEFSLNGQGVHKLPQALITDGNTLIEVDLLKDYYPETRGHIIRKRQAGEPLPDGGAGESRKRRRRRRRRRRKKVSDVTGRQSPDPQIPPQERGGEQMSRRLPMDVPVDAPVVNALDPSAGRREHRRRPRPSPVESAAPVLPENPVMSEMTKDNTNGLLRARELTANYVRTDNMRANRLKADRIKADKIRAQDVVVTAKRARRRRPKTSEFIQPEPMYERTGTQRFNSVVDNQILESQSPATRRRVIGQVNTQVVRAVPQYERSQPEQSFVRPRKSNRNAGFAQDIYEVPAYSETQVRSRRPVVEQPRYIEAPTTGFDGPTYYSQYQEPQVVGGDHLLDTPSVQAKEPLPEFSSTKVVRQYSRKRLVPRLSEFVAEGPSIQSIGAHFKKERIRERKTPRIEQFVPTTEFLGYDNPEIYSNSDTGSKSSSRDKTSKTFITRNDPWYI